MGAQTSSVLPSKLTPPPPTQGAVARPRLLARLDAGQGRRLTLLIAPAGYGKTTLLSQWVARQAAGQVAWCTLEETENDLSNFVGCLAAALAPAIPAAEQAWDLLAPSQSRPTEALSHLLHILFAHPHPPTLILDDVHQVAESAEVMAALDRFLHHAPPTLRLILAARWEPPLAAIPRLRAAGQVWELTEADLRFAPDEVIALAKATLHLTLNKKLATRLADRTEGWAVALQLACQTGIRYGAREAERILRRFGGTTRELYDYLARVVLAGQPEERQAFLRRTAVLDRLEADLCDALLERHDSAATLAELEQSGLFLFPLDSARTAYRYHALFHEFLQRRLQEVEGRETVRRLHRRAAALFLERRNDERAIVHLLAAGDYPAAADLIRPLRQRLFNTSRYHLLERWLEQFPPAFRETHPWLLLTRARLRQLRGDRAAAEQLYREAEPLLQAQQDDEGLYILYHDWATVVRAHYGDFAAAEELERQALAHAPTDADRAVVLGWIARCRYMAQGAEPEVFDRLEEAISVARRAGNQLALADLLSLRGQLRTGAGDLTAGLEDYYLALDLMEAAGNRHAQITTLLNAAYHHYLLGQLDQARDLVQRGLELARHFHRETIYAYGLNLRGLLYQTEGKEEAALRSCEEALAIQQRLGEVYEVAVTLNWLGLLHRRQNRPEEALRWGEEGLQQREQLGNEYETGLSLIDVGATYLTLGDLDRAAAMWQRAMTIFSEHQALYEQTVLHFYLAVLARHQGEEAKMVDHLEQAMALARRYEHGDPPRCLYLLIEEAEWTAPLLVHALRLGSVPDCVDCLLPRLGRPALKALLPLLEDRDPSLRARAATLLGRLGEADALAPLAAHRRDPDPTVRRAVEHALDRLLSIPPPPLRIQTLGRFRVRRGDEEIAHWPRRSARDVFLLLLEQTPRPVPKERLMDWLWPDSPPHKAAQNLRRAVSDLRRILEPELPPGLPSRYVATGDETYTLRLPEGSWVDAVAFEEALDRARDLSGEEAIASLEAALALHEGEYLPELPYEEWVLIRRERLRERYLEGLLMLGRHCEEAGRWRETVEAARRVLEQDPWNEEATRLLMHAYERSGDLPAALRAYEAFCTRLQDDLGLPPGKELTSLYKRLRRH